MAATPPRAAAPLPLTRGRRAALIIGVPVCLALIANTGFSLVGPFAEGSYPVSRAAPAGTRTLTVSTSGGQLSVRPAASGPATLAGTARYSFIRSTLTERTAGGGTALDYHCVPLPSGACGLDATVRVPAGLPVTASTGGGNAAVTGVKAAVTLSTGGGSLSVDHVTGPLNLNTNGGDIEAAVITAPALAAATGGGEIRATGVSASAVTLSTGGGNVEIVFTSVPRHVQVNTSGGDITLVLPRTAAKYHVTAQADGGGVNDSLPPGTGAPSSAQITATSGGGNITLREP